MEFPSRFTKPRLGCASTVLVDVAQVGQSCGTCSQGKVLASEDREQDADQLGCSLPLKSFFPVLALPALFTSLICFSYAACRVALDVFSRSFID